jgi:hypothetical protein
MRQISAEIDQASWLDRFHDRQLVAWQTRMLCSWLVKLTPDMSPEAAKEFIAEAANISLDGAVQPSSSKEFKKVQSKGKPTRKDFYDMDDEEIEKYLGKAENQEGSYEQLLGGFAKR